MAAMPEISHATLNAKCIQVRCDLAMRKQKDTREWDNRPTYFMFIRVHSWLEFP